MSVINWLSKVVLNGTEMEVKDSTARQGISENAEDIAENATDIAGLETSINTIWNGNVGSSRIYVSPDGNDNNPGTISQPMKSIVAAYNKMARYPSMSRAGFTLDILEGNYYETVMLGNFETGRLCCIQVHGSVNIYGCLRLCGNFNILRFDENAEISLYQDATYTTETYNNKSGWQDCRK